MLFGQIGLILCATTDLAERRIPKNLNLLLLTSLIPANQAISGLVIWITYVAVFRATKGGIGYGDVRLAPCTALLASSIQGSLLVHLLGWTIGAIFVLLCRRPKGQSLPFAPFLALSGLILSADR